MPFDLDPLQTAMDSLRHEQTGGCKDESTKVTVTAYVETKLRPDDLHDRRAWSFDFREAINLRESAYRVEEGGQALDFDRLEDIYDIQHSLFILMWVGDKLVHSFKGVLPMQNGATSLFETWTENRWSPNAGELTRGCTLPAYKKKGFYGFSLAMMGLVLHGSGCPRAAVMLSSTFPPNLVDMFQKTGFERIEVKDAAKPGSTLTTLELKSNCFACNCGYKEQILLAPYVVTLQKSSLQGQLRKYHEKLHENGFCVEVNRPSVYHAAVDSMREAS